MEKLAPYISLIKNNTNYRWLWLSQAVSNFGDWFGLLAIYALIAKYSDSELLLGLLIVVKMVSLALFSPMAGYITDRFNRRKLMILCDVLRALAVFSMLLVHSRETLWLAFVLTSIQMMISSVFEPAKTASIPNVTTKEELMNANIISTATWSVIFTTGMAMGGFATEWLGIRVTLLVDAITYLISGWFIWRAAIPQTTMSLQEKVRTRNPLTGITEGLSYLNKNRHILRPGIAKGTASAFMGGLVYMLVIVSEDVLMMGSIGLGLLYAARGIGTGIGPIIGRRLFPDERSWIMAMGGAMVLAGLMYMVVGSSNSIATMVVFVLLAHSASGANWVKSTVLLQQRTTDTYRGRVFSTEWLLFTVMYSVSVMIASLILEYELVEIKSLIIIYGGLLVLAGIIWSLSITPKERAFQQQQMELKTSG